MICLRKYTYTLTRPIWELSGVAPHGQETAVKLLRVTHQNGSWRVFRPHRQNIALIYLES
jgi:hypothetical protein